MFCSFISLVLSISLSYFPHAFLSDLSEAFRLSIPPVHAQSLGLLAWLLFPPYQVSTHQSITTHSPAMSASLPSATNFYVGAIPLSSTPTHLWFEFSSGYATMCDNSLPNFHNFFSSFASFPTTFFHSLQEICSCSL